VTYYSFNDAFFAVSLKVWPDTNNGYVARIHNAGSCTVLPNNKGVAGGFACSREIGEDFQCKSDAEIRSLGDFSKFYLLIPQSPLILCEDDMRCGAPFG
jgi:hypothetical protein